MRVTQNATYSALHNQIARNSQTLLEAQEKVATEKKINRLSDDPVDAGRLLDLKGSLSSTTQYLSNIERVSSLAKIQDSALSDITDLIGNAKQLLLKETSETSSTGDTREATRIEIAIMTSELRSIGNTVYDGQYIFSGFATNTEAFADNTVSTAATSVTGGAVVTGQSVADSTMLTYHTYEVQFTGSATYNVVDTDTGATVLAGQAYTSGQAINFDGLELTLTDSTGTPQAGDVYTVTTAPAGTYQGDGQLQKVQIESGSYVQQNITGDQVFQGSSSSDGVDLFGIFNRINTALADNDQTGMSALLDELDKALEQVTTQQSAVGARVNLLKNAGERQTDIQTNLETLRSNLEDIDVTDAVLELSKQQDIYNATLSTASSVIQMSLLDFLD